MNDEMLQRYADAAITAGLNLRPGQRLMIIGPRTTGGVSPEAAPLVYYLVRSAYRAGSPLVEVLWGDERLALVRFEAAGDASFSQYSDWQAGALIGYMEAGHALLSVYANDPDLFQGQPADRVAALQQAAARALQPFSEHVARNSSNWLVVCAAAARWADKVFPELEPAMRTARLWDEIFRMCRVDAGAAAGWQAHLDSLERRSAALNARRFAALRYRGPGTDLTIGLPDDHLWVSGRSVSRNGVRFAPNMPTEEVFTVPHKDRVDGIVQSSKPLSYGGVLIDDFTVRFAAGRAVEVHAAKGLPALEAMIASDDSADRLGEVALVPHSSPISQSGRLFYNTLFDENAASHVALGSAYRFTMKGGEAMSDEAFAAAGGNRSMIHVDFMIGNGRLDIDGVSAGGIVEPIMRNGDWVEGL